MNQVIIVGLARSGTTFLAECLNDAGISMWGDDEKPDFCEDKKIVALNGLQNHLNGGKYVKNLIPAEEFIAGLEVYKAKRNRMHSGELYGFKEPRIIFFYETYKSIFPKAKFICCIRNPISATKSMMLHKGYTNFNAVYKDTCLSSSLIKDGMYLFNYDGNIEAEQKSISEFIGVDVNLIKNWKPKCK